MLSQGYIFRKDGQNPSGALLDPRLLKYVELNQQSGSIAGRESIYEDDTMSLVQRDQFRDTLYTMNSGFNNQSTIEDDRSSMHQQDH